VQKSRRISHREYPEARSVKTSTTAMRLFIPSKSNRANARFFVVRRSGKFPRYFWENDIAVLYSTTPQTVGFSYRLGNSRLLFTTSAAAQLISSRFSLTAGQPVPGIDKTELHCSGGLERHEIDQTARICAAGYPCVTAPFGQGLRTVPGGNQATREWSHVVHKRGQRKQCHGEPS